jgi:hypothetical protein
LRNIATLVATGELLASSSVYPSGSARVTVCAAMKLLPPGRFSTTTGFPSRSSILRARYRALESVPLPGGKDTTSLMGLSGYSLLASIGVSAPPIVTTSAHSMAHRRVADVSFIPVSVLSGFV